MYAEHRLEEVFLRFLGKCHQLVALVGNTSHAIGLMVDFILNKQVRHNFNLNHDSFQAFF